MSAFRTKAHRRRFDQVCSEADKMVEADAKFFDRFPHRTHRVRPASRAEMEANALATGGTNIITNPGQRWFTVVKQIGPGVRSRVFLQNDSDVEWDMDEAHAQIVYDLYATPGSKAWQIEQHLKTLMAVRGRR